MLVRLLQQLESQPSLAGAPVIVTLNLADEVFDATPYRALRMTVVRNATPRGFGANHNAAFQQCRSRWFVVLNPDLVLVDGEPFTRIVHRAQDIARIGVAAPQVIGPRGAPEDSVRANLTPWSLLRRRVLGERAPLQVHRAAQRGAPFYWLAGMCLLLDADAFTAVGGFDERYFLYCEDYDLCARLYNAGYAVVFEPAVQIVHEAQRDSHRSLRHLRWHLASLSKVWLSRAFWRVTLGLG